MRILTILNVGYPTVGGLQITHQTNMRLLGEKFGHDCLYLDSSLTRRKRRVQRFFTMDSYRDTAELQQKISAYEPDVLVAGFTAVHHAVKLGRQHGLPVIGWLNSYEYCPPSKSEAAMWHLTQTHRYPDQQERSYALENADQIITNSNYMRQRLWQQANVDSEVIYPTFSRDLLLPGPQNGEFITGICGYPHKGAELFLALAAAFPDQLFLQAGPVHTDYQQRFQSFPNVQILPFSPAKKILQQAKVIIVPSIWPEPFGRIAVEAMVNGIPALVSRHAGLGEIVGSGPQGIDDFSNQQAWIKALHALLVSDEVREANVQNGQHIAMRYFADGSMEQFNDLLQPLKKQAVLIKPAVQLVGDQLAASAVSMINKQLQKGLEQRYAVYPTDTIESFIPAVPKFVLHHDYGQEFSALKMPDAGHFIAVRTWDFGRYPAEWAKRIKENCDQLWVYSHWTKKQAVLSGIPRGRIKVIPPGFDSDIYKPEGHKFDLVSNKSFIFLFTGAAVLRKGIDILLKAYKETFSQKDDVCLIIKDNRDDRFYQGERWHEQIEQIQALPHSPEIQIIDQFLPEADLAALYRRATVGVFPYRAEGFALPILELMACGIPSIVPRFGACLDFCNTQSSFFVPAKRINLPVIGEFTFNTLGFSEEIDEVDFCEMLAVDLAVAMRQIYEQWQRDGGQQIKRHAQAGVQAAHSRFTWQHSYAHMHKALEDAQQVRTPIRLRHQRQNNERQKKIFASARELYLSLPGSENLPIRED